jgi:thymidylate synthase (FAD)
MNVQFYTQPEVRLIARPLLNLQGVGNFITAENVSWELPEHDGEGIVEFAGRLCYMSFGKGRKNITDYLANILESKHGSVLEHAHWAFVLTQVSRSCTHELVRHRHLSYSQLSQRYVDESGVGFVVPEGILNSPNKELLLSFQDHCRQSLQTYIAMMQRLEVELASEPDKTLRRKLARQTARSVLPNATETKIVVSGNARAWRHFLETRGSIHAESEIRKVALAIWRVLMREAPNIFGDFVVIEMGGVETLSTEHTGV